MTNEKKVKIKTALMKEIMPLPKSDKATRILYIDALKLIAALCVVFYHFAYYRLDYGVIEKGKYIPNFNRVVMCFAACSVPLFFMINGMLLFSKERKHYTMILKAIKLLILYFVWSYVGCPSWFLRTLAILYLLFPLFQWVRDKHRRIYISLMLCLFLIPFIYNAVMLFYTLFTGNTEIIIMGLHFSRTGLFTMYSILYFLLGSEFLKKDFSISLGIFFFIFGWVFLVFECWVYTKTNGTIWDGVNASFPTIGALLLSIGIFSLFKKINFEKIKLFLVFSADTIFPIYLLHMPIIILLGEIMVLSKIYLIVAFLLTILIVSICGLLGKILHKIPVLCWFVRI